MASIELIKASDGTGNANVATIQSTRAALATTIDVDTVNNINAAGFAATMGTPHTFTDPVTSETITVISEATAVDFFGHVDGTNLEIDTIAPGYTDAGSAVGDIVIIRPTTQWGDEVATILEVAHNDDGTLKDDSVTAGVIADNAIDGEGLFVDSVDPVKRASESQVFDYVASGAVWSGDAYASTRAASMTAGVFYINGQRGTISAVTARSFTASKDTYIDVLNTAGVFTLVYTEVTNNAASPALASNSIRIGIIVTGASNIAAATSINQGQETRLLPIASSTPYAVTDSLGNLICPRDPNRRILGYRQNVSNQTYTTPYATVPGLTCPVIVPTGRKIKITHWARSLSSSAGAGTNSFIAIVESSTVLSEGASTAYTANAAVNPSAEAVLTPSAGLHTYLGQAKTDAGTGSIAGAATYPNFIRVELV